MDNPFIQQSKRNIELLISSKKYQEAMNLCNAILSRYPGNQEFSKIAADIEKDVEKTNGDMVDQKIEEMDPLWDAEKYQEILSGLKYLMKYSPNHKKLQKLYSKAQALYKAQITELRDSFRENQNKKLEKLLKENPEKLLEELYALEKKNPGNQDVIEITKKFREQYIHRKIDEKKELIYSDKYELIEEFIESLKKIDGKNMEIAKLEKLIKQRKLDNLVAQRKEYIYKGENYISTLIRLKKYADAIKVAQELLSVDKDDKEAKKLIKKAKNLYFEQTKEKTINMITSDKEKLETEYQTNKATFVKI